VPNVSAVVFRRTRLLSVLEAEIDTIASLRVAGDYLTYVLLLLGGGDMAFVAESLNNHRRHERGLTIGSHGARVVTEIARVQRRVARDVSLSPEVQAHADQYRADLLVQFGLPDEVVRARPH
jgi:hypothetical protein